MGRACYYPRTLVGFAVCAPPVAPELPTMICDCRVRLDWLKSWSMVMGGPSIFYLLFVLLKKKPQKRIDHATGANGLMPTRRDPMKQLSIIMLYSVPYCNDRAQSCSAVSFAALSWHVA